MHHTTTRIVSHFRPFILIGFLLFGLVSCNTTKRVAYFQDLSDSVSNSPIYLHLTKYIDPVILPGDRLAITVQTIEEVNFGSANEETAISNPESIPIPSRQYNQYQVDQESNIYIPILGKIKTKDHSTAMLRDSILTLASKYFKDPLVTVHLTNFTVTVLGEVTKPGVYISPNEKVSILDALGFAGDMTIYGKKDNILILRNEQEKKLAVRLDLNSSQSFNSPYYYLKQGDAIFVEADKAKITTLKDGYKTRHYALTASGLSVLIILLSRLTF